MDNSERLYAEILQRNFKTADRLIAKGASLDGDIRDALVKGPSGAVNFVPSRYKNYEQFKNFAAHASVDDFAAVTEKLFELVGEPIYNTFGEYRYNSSYRDKFYDPKFFETLLKYCSGKQMRKRWTMEEIIDRDSTELLALCAKYGWLKMPRIRDEMIKYSQENNHPECTAWLLEFKNRNFDLAAERAKAEKKMLRELNADPNSLTEIRKIWKTKKLEDADRTSVQGRRQSDPGGTLVITSYRGSHSEVVVPRTIGKDTVTAIGYGAFSGMTWDTNRTPKEICDIRKENITKITLPETVTVIGENAFSCCSNLKAVNVPYGVKVIEENTFRSTGIEAIELPETVERIKGYAFWGCRLKTIKLPQSLTEISSDTFSYSWLEKIEIPAGVKVIPKSSFWHCANLREVILHEGIEEIKPAFFDCQSLEKINFPASIKKIANYKRDGKTVSPFADSPKLTATVERGSYAEKYCAKNDIRFKYSDEV